MNCITYVIKGGHNQIPQQPPKKSRLVWCGLKNIIIWELWLKWEVKKGIYAKKNLSRPTGLEEGIGWFIHSGVVAKECGSRAAAATSPQVSDAPRPHLEIWSPKEEKKQFVIGKKLI